MKKDTEIWLWLLGGAGVVGALAYFFRDQASEAVDTAEDAVYTAVEATGLDNGPFYDQFLSATDTASVPAEWANLPSLLSLVRHESNWDPAAKNPTSSAFGLFQFITTTWAQYLSEVPYGTVDPYWQAVGGFRYIAAKYGNPDRAWGFWQATVHKDTSYAPADLQTTAAQWISKNWGGY